MEPLPRLVWGGPATPKLPLKEEEEEEGEEERMAFGLLGVAEATPTASMGWLKPPLGPYGFRPPQKAKK